MVLRTLSKFFNPKSVAIIGASHTKGKIGYAILENFVKGHFKGKVYPVNPDTSPILGLTVYSSVKAIPGKVDLAVVVVPAIVVPKVLKECVAKRIEAVIVVSGGFSETGERGRKLEEELKKIIRGTKTRLLGVNGLGVYDPVTDVDTIFNPRSRLSRPPAGTVGFISQSGAVGATILDWLAEEGIGISKFISYENATDINECDCLEYLGMDRKTKVIALFIEGVKDGKRFIKIAKKVSRKKPIVVLKGGKTKAGAKAAASHTGALAGSAAVYSAVFKQTGAIEARNWSELFDYAKAFSQPLPKGNRIAIITNGGGFGVLAADECERQGLQLPEPSAKLKRIFNKNFPAYASLRNPIDLTGDATAERYRIALEACLASKEYDGAIVIALFQIPTLEPEVTDVLIGLKKYKKPVICCSAGGRYSKKLSKRLEAGGIPVYLTPTQAVKAMAALVRYHKWLRR